MTALLFVRFCLAIVADALAFIVWDIGTRPPLQLASDILHGVRRLPTLLLGVARLLAGIGLLFAGATLAQPGAPTLRAFMLLETGMLIAALLVENFIGPDVRRLVRRRA